MPHAAPLAGQTGGYAIDQVDAFAVPGRRRPIKIRVQSLPDALRRLGPVTAKLCKTAIWNIS